MGIFHLLIIWCEVQFIFFLLHQFSSVTQLCPTLCGPMDCRMPGLPVHHQLPVFTQTHVHRVSDAIHPSHPLSFPSPPAFNLSQHQGLFKWVSSSPQVAKVLEFQLQHQSFNEYLMISFWMDWLDLLAVQGTLKSLLQHHNSKASILQCSAFFIVTYYTYCIVLFNQILVDLVVNFFTRKEKNVFVFFSFKHNFKIPCCN